MWAWHLLHSCCTRFISLQLTVCVELVYKHVVHSLYHCSRVLSIRTNMKVFSQGQILNTVLNPNENQAILTVGTRREQPTMGKQPNCWDENHAHLSYVGTKSDKIMSILTISECLLHL